MGEIVEGGVTNITSVSFSGLALLSEYTLHLWAYPSMADEAATASDEAILTCSTSFYTALNDSGVLTSAVVPNGSCHHRGGTHLSGQIRHVHHQRLLWR